MEPFAKRRILLVGINHAPEHIGTGKYTGEMAAWLAARGHVVRAVTASPYYPDWRVWPGYRQWRYRRGTIDGVDVIRCPFWVPRKPRGLTRLLHLASFGLSSLPVALASVTWKPDVVVNVAPTLASAPGAWLTARLAGARAWLHIQDFELDAALDMGIVDAGPARRIAMAIERWLLRRFDRISTISPKMVERLAAKGIPVERRVLFPNWADIEAIQPLTAPSPYRRELGIPDDAIVALYSGNMGQKQGLELLGEAARILGPEEGARGTCPGSGPETDEGTTKADILPPIHFVFGGDGPGRPPLEDVCRGMANVHFLPLQPLDRLNDWLGLADIHLLPQRADVADLVMPSKLTGMLASGRPTVATALPGTGVALALGESGLVTPPGDGIAFANALRRLASDAALRTRLGSEARRQAEQTLARDAILARFESALSAAIASTGYSKH